MDTIEIAVTRPSFHLADHPQTIYYFTGSDYTDAVIKARFQFPDDNLSIKVTKTFENGKWNVA